MLRRGERETAADVIYRQVVTHGLAQIFYVNTSSVLETNVWCSQGIISEEVPCVETPLDSHDLYFIDYGRDITSSVQS
jgi:hypothetical protein